LLALYILHTIALKPKHGYEIIQDINAKTEGAWSPGAGSIYPILKKLVSEGLIKPETPGAVDDRHVYHVTQKGTTQLKQLKETFANFGQRWGAMRSLFMELVDPEKTEAVILDGSRRQFEFMQDFVKSRMKNVPEADMEYVLREYGLNLERQLNWTNQTLSGMKVKAPKPLKASPQVTKATKWRRDS